MTDSEFRATRRQDHESAVIGSCEPHLDAGNLRSAAARCLLSGIITAALMICSVCSSKTAKPTPPPLGVTVAPVIQKDVPIHQEWVGTMVGNVDAEIRPKVGGYLLTRLYQEGSYVTRGQSMFQLDQRQAQAAVAQAKGKLERARATLAQAQIDVRRYTPLVAQRAVSQAELDHALSSERAATAEVAANQADLDDANLNLSWTTVTSPISGIAGVAKVGIGDLMTPVTIMTTVSSVDPIYVDFNISEQDYMRFAREKTGQSASRNLELFLGDGAVLSQRGRALLVNREVDSRTGTIQVRGEFPNHDNVLRPGQYARIRAVTELRKGALLVPQASVSEVQGTYQVGVVAPDNKVTMRTVRLGPQIADMWVVESGLQVGDNVVVDGLQRVKGGMIVAPTPYKDTQANALNGGT
jgi:membrane fusion protein (multidrug efflux system)